MRIFALETSAKAASCALCDGETLISEFFLNAGLTHSQTVMPMAEAVLRLAGITASDIDLFAVSNGPGSFTGVRIGVSAVKGMAMASGKPCAAVSALEALACNVPDFRGFVVPVMDARRDQVYTAIFSAEGAFPVRKTEDMAISIDGLFEKIREYGAPSMLVGDGAELCYERLSGKTNGLLLAPESLRHQRASGVCRVAMTLGRGEYKTAGTLEPFYLRLPQAERERLENLK